MWKYNFQLKWTQSRQDLPYMPISGPILYLFSAFWSNLPCKLLSSLLYVFRPWPFVYKVHGANCTFWNGTNIKTSQYHENLVCPMLQKICKLPLLFQSNAASYYRFLHWGIKRSAVSFLGLDQKQVLISTKFTVGK